MSFIIQMVLSTEVLRGELHEKKRWNEHGKMEVARIYITHEILKKSVNNK